MRHLAASAMAGLLPHNELRPPPAKAMPGVLPHRICRNNMQNCNGRASCTWLQAACTARRLAANRMHGTLTTSCTPCTASSPPCTPPPPHVPSSWLQAACTPGCKPHARHGPIFFFFSKGYLTQVTSAVGQSVQLAASRMQGAINWLQAACKARSTACKPHARRDQLAASRIRE